MATSTSTADDGVEKIVLKDIPANAEDFESWRYAASAQILASVKDSLSAMLYLQSVEDLSIDFATLSATLPPEQSRLDVRVFAAVTIAAKGQDNIFDMIRSRATFGCGRQALRILDQLNLREATLTAVRATKKINNLECSNLDGLETYIALFNLCRHQMGTGEHKLTEAMGCDILRGHCIHVNGLSAVFAQFDTKMLRDCPAHWTLC